MNEFDFVKGYADDAGCDVILKKDVIFNPQETQVIDLEVTATPKENTMGFLCSRTSAAKKGLIVAMCPIDPNYNGTIHAIVHNVSNDTIIYYAGEAFCQLVFVPILTNVVNAKIKKEGKRSSGNFGSTGGDGRMK